MEVFTPARPEPFFAEQFDRLDDDYYVTRTDRRTMFSFRVPPVEPEMVDDHLKGTMTLGEFRTAYQNFEVSKNITVPVLVELSEFDTYFYNPQTEEDYSRALKEAIRRNPSNFTHAPLFKNAGHNLTQHPNAHEHYQVMYEWMKANNLA